MPENEQGSAPNVFPSILYKDAVAASDFLARAFGFEKLMEMPGPDGTISHAEMKFGPGVIMLNSLSEGHERRSAVYVYVEDLDAHYERAKAAGAEILRGIEDIEYGARMYTACDPERNVWFFGTYRPQM